MPNDITSDITFVGLHDVIQQLIQVNLRFSHFFPEVPELVALDELFPSGYAHILEQSENSVTFRVFTVSDPPLDALHAMTDLFPDLYIRCLWRDEGGREGLWVTTLDDDMKVREIRWFGPCLEAYHMDPSLSSESKYKGQSVASTASSSNVL